jgi:hypothetical protein
MSRFILIIVFFLTSCSSNIAKNDFNFSDEMSFDEFKLELDAYAKNNPYPNIDD